ncbi:MAG: divalent metal cation transporter [Veillonellales bacterium]
MKNLSFFHSLFPLSPARRSALLLVGLAVNAGSLLSWALIGSIFGLHLLWAFLPAAVALLAAQKISIHLGAVTGKELTGLIRENFKLRTTGLMLTGLLLTDIINLIAQFAGIAVSLAIFGFSPWVTVPAAALLIHWTAQKRLSPSAGKIFLLTGTLYSLFIAAGITGSPWAQVIPALRPLDLALESDYLMMLLALIGSIMAPRILLYSQSAATKKSSAAANPSHCRYFLAASLFTVLFAFLLVGSYAGTLFAHNVDLLQTSIAALALQPLTGSWAPLLFAYILLSASLFSAAAIPLSAAYSVCDVIGCKAGLDKSRQEAPVFHRSYTLILLLGALPILFPEPPYLHIMLWSQIANSIFLPFLLFFLLRLSTSRNIMDLSSPCRIGNGITWISSSFIGILLILLTITALFPDY